MSARKLKGFSGVLIVDELSPRYSEPAKHLTIVSTVLSVRGRLMRRRELFMRRRVPSCCRLLIHFLRILRCSMLPPARSTELCVRKRSPLIHSRPPETALFFHHQSGRDPTIHS